MDSNHLSNCCSQNLKSTFYFSFGAEIKSQIKISCQMTYKDYWLICGSFITVLVVEGLMTSRRFARSTETNATSVYSLPEGGEKKKEKSRCKVSASFTAPCSGARKQKRRTPTRRRGPSGSFERRFLVESGRNAEADFTNECHLTIRLVG